MCVYFVCVDAHVMYAMTGVYGDQKKIYRSQFFPFVTCSLGIELRASGLAASTFTYEGVSTPSPFFLV